MADPTVVESAATLEVQAKAQAMGWIPPERYKGDPERFTDAEEYLARGEQVLPIVRAHNRRLQEELDRVRHEGDATKAALAAAQKAIDEIEERHSVATVRAVQEAKKSLQAELAAAHEAGDHAKIAEITGLMIDLNDSVEAQPPKQKEAVPAAPEAKAVPADLAAWNKDNPWFGSDKRKTALALGIAQELRDAGTELVGRDFYEKVREELEATLGGSATPASKVEGARGSDGGSSRSAAAKSYSALPADAKAACDADAKNFVGAGKKYKTTEEWRKRYAEIYFE